MSSSPRTRPLARLLPLAAFAASLALSHAFPLVDPDEGRNAEVAREMAASGDLVVPHLAGMPYLDKPPGLYWAAALAIRAFGNRPWAVRLPAALAAALTLMLVMRAAMRGPGDAFAWRVGALLAAAPLFAFLSAYVIFDMPLTACVTVVWLGVASEAERGPSPRRRLAMYVAVLLGVLIKGPVMLAWVVGGSLAAALALRARAPLRWLAWWPGWVLTLLVAGGWFALASARYPEYPHYAFLEESLERMTSGSFRREQPVWFVPAVLIAGALPWSLATPWTRRLGATSRVALGFVLFAAVFFTLSRSKLVTYLLPALPPLAWIAADAWGDPARARRGAWGVAAIYLVLALGVAVASGRLATQGGPAVADDVRRALPLLAALFGAAGAVAAFGAIARRPRVGLVAALAFVPLTLAAAGRLPAAYANTQSGMPLARALASRFPDGKVRYERCYSPGTDFMLGRESEILDPAGRVTTSNYQQRYRTRLIARGEWRVRVAPPDPDDAAVIVRPAREVPPGGDRPGDELHRDARFVAYRVTPAPAP